MRMISVLLAGAILASCTTGPPVPTRTADKQREFQQLLYGKVAQRPRKYAPTTRPKKTVPKANGRQRLKRGERGSRIDHRERLANLHPRL